MFGGLCAKPSGGIGISRQKDVQFQVADLDIMSMRLRNDPWIQMWGRSSTHGSNANGRRPPTQFSVGTLVSILETLRVKLGKDSIEDVLDKLNA